VINQSGLSQMPAAFASLHLGLLSDGAFFSGRVAGVGWVFVSQPGSRAGRTPLGTGAFLQAAGMGRRHRTALGPANILPPVTSGTQSSREDVKLPTQLVIKCSYVTL